MQEVEKFPQQNITTLVGDMTSPETHKKIADFLESIWLKKCHLITSDVAPKTTGRNDDDQYHSAMLCLEVLKVAEKFLAPGGNLTMKVFV